MTTEHHPPPSDRPPVEGEILTVADVMARYGLRDRRAARTIMDSAGGCVLAANLYVRRADLLALEETQKREREARTRPDARPRRTTPAPGAVRPRTARPLRAGWWRQQVLPPEETPG